MSDAGNIQGAGDIAGFWAPLPDGCPPVDAAPFPAGLVYRLVANNPCTADDFRSRFTEGAPEPEEPYDGCRWRACSVHVGDRGLRRLRKIAKMPWFRHLTYIAHVAVDQNSGIAMAWPGDPTHFSFWLYDHFDAPSAVQAWEVVT